MGRILQIILLTLIALGCFSAEGAIRENVKCYVTTSQGEQILFYSWEEKKIEKHKQKLNGKRLPDLNGNPNYVKYINECVLQKESFSSKQANQLERITLR